MNNLPIPQNGNVTEALVALEAQDLEVLERRANQKISAWMMCGLGLLFGALGVVSMNVAAGSIGLGALGGAVWMSVGYLRATGAARRASARHEARASGLSEVDQLVLRERALLELRREDTRASATFLGRLALFVFGAIGSVVLTAIFLRDIRDASPVALVVLLAWGATGWAGVTAFAQWLPRLMVQGVQRRRNEIGVLRERRRLLEEAEVAGALELHRAERRGGELSVSEQGRLALHEEREDS